MSTCTKAVLDRSACHSQRQNVPLLSYTKSQHSQPTLVPFRHFVIGWVRGWGGPPSPC